MRRDLLAAARRHVALSTAAVAAAAFATGIAAAGPYAADPSFGPDPNQVASGREADEAPFREGTPGWDEGTGYDRPVERWDGAPVPARDPRYGVPPGAYDAPSADRSRPAYGPTRPLPAASGRAPQVTHVPPGHLKKPPGHAGRHASAPSAAGSRAVNRRPVGHSASAAVPTRRGHESFGRAARSEPAMRPQPPRPAGGLGLFIDLGSLGRRTSDARRPADEARRSEQAADGGGDAEDEDDEKEKRDESDDDD